MVSDLAKLVGYVFVGEDYIHDEAKDHFKRAIMGHYISSDVKVNIDELSIVVDDYAEEIAYNLGTTHMLLIELHKKLPVASGES